MSDVERQELQEMAKSTAVREEFRALKAASALPSDALPDLDVFVHFLTVMHRVLPLPPRRFVEHRRVLL